MSNTPPAISVIVPTFNRPVALKACLKALAAQEDVPGGFEVVVIDDGSRPSSADHSALMPVGISLRVVRQDNAGPASARNHGVRLAQGRFLAFTDDDCQPRPDWLVQLLEVLLRHPDKLVGGTTINALSGNVCAQMNQWITDRALEHYNADPAGPRFFASNNIACMRGSFLSHGGFDARFRFSSEDRDLCDRWRHAGNSLVYAPLAIVDHYHGQSLPAFAKMYYRYGKGSFQYNRQRGKRKTGSLRGDMPFHARLLDAAWHGESAPESVHNWQLRSLIAVWWLANAFGYVVAALGARFGGRP